MSDLNGLQVTADRGCFVCGPDNPSGINARFEIDKENGAASSCLTLDQRFQGWKGVVHGGILATLLDEVAIYACRGQGEQFVTAEINVRFRKPVPVDSAIDLKGQIVGNRHRIYRVKSRIEIGGALYAEAEVRVMRIDH